VITVTMSVAIGADRRRVWEALTRPEALVRWNPGRSAPLDVPEGYPKPGKTARWRYRLRSLPLPLTERPLEVVPAARLRSELRLALVRFDQTYTLAEEAGDPRRTRLSLKLVFPNAIPLVDGLLDRFGVRALAQQIVDDNLRALRDFCESDVQVLADPARRVAEPVAREG
jgi:uncharacterized protein YndB with AHSA1/START domain